MSEILRSSFDFPTVVFTAGLGIAAVLWLVTLVGVGDSDDLGDGLLDGFGLADVPLNLVVSIVAIAGWAISVLAQLFLLDGRSGAVIVIVGLVVLVVAGAVGLWLVARLAPVLRKTFQPTMTFRAGDLVGRIAEVRSATVDHESGYGDVTAPDGSTSRIQLRSVATTSSTVEKKSQNFRTGDQVLIVVYDEARQCYLVDADPALP